MEGESWEAGESSTRPGHGRYWPGRPVGVVVGDLADGRSSRGGRPGPPQGPCPAPATPPGSRPGAGRRSTCWPSSTGGACPTWCRSATPASLPASWWPPGRPGSTRPSAAGPPGGGPRLPQPAGQVRGHAGAGGVVLAGRRLGDHRPVQRPAPPGRERPPGPGPAPHQPGRAAPAHRAGGRRTAVPGGPAAAHPRRGVPPGLGRGDHGPLPGQPLGRAAPAAQPVPAPRPPGGQPTRPTWPLRPAVRLGPARTHARSGDGATISGYLGTGDRFDRAVADFAEAYADQTEADYAAFTRAQGSAPAERGRGGGTNQRKGDGG